MVSIIKGKKRYEGVNILTQTSRFSADGKGYSYDILLNNKREKNMRFKAIVSNPPYQNANERNQGSSKKLWMEFVEKSIELLEDDGYYMVIHPIGWRSWKNWMWEKIYQKYQIVSATLEPEIDWNVGVKTDYYLLKKCPYTEPTIVKVGDKTFNIDFRTVDGICVDETANKILSYIGEKCNFQQSCENHTQNKPYSKTPDEVNKYPFCHTAKNIYYAPTPQSIQTTPKVLISYSGYMIPRYDDVNGTSQHCYYHLVDNAEEGAKLVDYFKSKLFNYVASILKTNGFNDKKILNSIPLFKDYDTISEVYDMIGLNENDVKAIESHEV